MRRKKKDSVTITKQDREAEWGKPVFSFIIMQRKVKEIFRCMCFEFLKMKVIKVEITGTVLAIGGIVFFSLSNKEFWGMWLMLILAIFLLYRYLKGTILPILWMLYCSYIISKSRETIEMEFYINNLSLYIGGREFKNYPYAELEEISILPKETWLIFKNRKAVLLPEHSITAGQREDILDFLRGIGLGIKFHNN